MYDEYAYANGLYNKQGNAGQARGNGGEETRGINGRKTIIAPELGKSDGLAIPS